MGSIPALNYTIRHSLDRLRRQHQYYEQEILITRKLMFGLPGVATAPSFGIVSATDPVGHVAGSTDTLVVSQNGQDPLSVDVNAGYGVFLSGVWIQLHAAQVRIALADTTPAVPNVVYLQYMLDTAAVSLNDSLQAVSPYTFRIGGTIDTSALSESILIGTLTVTDYLSLSATIREDYIPLAIVTVQSISGGTDLDIDHTRASYAWNRPWFSPADVYHRSQVGTGTVTATNIHGLSGNDLTYTYFTALQVQTEHGMVLADDKSYAKVPGYRCELNTKTFLVDATGALTGFAGATYVELPYYPVAVGLINLIATSEVIAGQHVPGTNRIVFPYETPATDIHIYYTRVEACEPPLPNTTTFATNSPAEDELIIAGGLGLDALSNVEETMGDAWQFPQRYDFFVDGEGALLKTPQVVYCWKLLDSLTIGSFDPTTITPYGPGRVIVGLSGAVVGFANIDIRIHGTDVNGAVISYLAQYTGGTWLEPRSVVPNPVVTPAAFRVSTVDFATVTSVEVVTRVGDGHNSGIMVWLAQTPYSNYDKMKDGCHVASTVWDGLRFSEVYDKRVIASVSRPELTAVDSSQTEMMIRLLAGNNTTVYHEDLRRPKYASLVNVTTMYPTYALSKWQPGIHGGYYSAALPVVPGSGNVWTVSLFGLPHRDTTFMLDTPTLSAYDGVMWHTLPMTPVAGLPGTYRVNTVFNPTRVSVLLLFTQAQSYVVYG